MERRHRLNGPALRRLREARGYHSAAALAARTGLTARQIYDIENGRARIAETDYANILHLFGLEPGALLAHAAPCPHCGHVAAAPEPPEGLTDAA